MKGTWMHQQRGIVLLVDGDVGRAHRLAQRLEEFDYEIRFAQDGATGLLKAHELLPDVAVVDMKLPILDGYGMLRALHAQPPKRIVPVIMITEGSSQEELARAWSAGAEFCLPRNREETDLPLLIRRLVSNGRETERAGQHGLALVTA